MMQAKTVLCLDEATCCNPEFVGLDGEAIGSQDWLQVCTKGGEARAAVASGEGIVEAWVVSCDDVEPINLAASIKADRPAVRVSLVASELCGSLMSRAHTADIDEVIDLEAFRRHYSHVKQEGFSPSDERSADVSSVRQLSQDKGELEGLAASVGTPVIDLEAAEPAAVLAPAEELAPPQFAQSSLHLPVAQSQFARISTASDNRAFVMTVVSGSGGAGKSSVSALGAVISQKMGYRTLLLDCDLQFGDVAALVGVESPVRMDDLLIHPERLDAELGQGESLSVLAAPQRLEFSEEVVRTLPDLLDRLVVMFDVIVVNTGASWAEQHAVLLERSSAALFLIDQRASSVRACRHALELCARCGIATNPFHFALNRCAKGSPLTSIDVSCALQGVPVFELKDGGREVEDYLSGGAAGELLELKNEFAKSLEQVMGHLLPAGSRRLDEHSDGKSARRHSLRRGSKSSRKRGRDQR